MNTRLFTVAERWTQPKTILYKTKISQETLARKEIQILSTNRYYAGWNFTFMFIYSILHSILSQSTIA